MKIIAKLIFHFLRLILRSKQAIVLENLALRQQLAVQQRSIKRPKIKNADRIFWAWLSRIWYDWKASQIIVKPPTVKDYQALHIQYSVFSKQPPVKTSGIAVFGIARPPVAVVSINQLKLVILKSELINKIPRMKTRI